MSSTHSSMNFYDILGVSSDADIPTIQKAFRTMSLKYHPDRANNTTIPNGTETENERQNREKRNHDRYVRITQARDTLVDEAKRKAYDMFLRDDNEKTNDRRNKGRGHSKSETQSKPKSDDSKSKSKTDESRSRSKTDESKSRKSKSDDSKSRKSKSDDSKSRSRSKSSYTEESRADISTRNLIDAYLHTLYFELAAIRYLVHKICYVLNTIVRSPVRTNYLFESLTFLEEILPRSRVAREDVLDAIDDLEALRRGSLSATEKTSRAINIYEFVENGALEYLHRMERRIDDLQPVIMRQLQEYGR
ncbi:hypothetical protein F4803DRAFT_576405 [Xylaria telfairii]|nr:hypothetical protein F4803DRAFT_576405 [Xylaria telfairii]